MPNIKFSFIRSHMKATYILAYACMVAKVWGLAASSAVKFSPGFGDPNDVDVKVNSYTKKLAQKDPSEGPIWHDAQLHGLYPNRALVTYSNPALMATFAPPPGLLNFVLSQVLLSGQDPHSTKHTVVLNSLLKMVKGNYNNCTLTCDGNVVATSDPDESCGPGYTKIVKKTGKSESCTPYLNESTKEEKSVAKDSKLHEDEGK